MATIIGAVKLIVWDLKTGKQILEILDMDFTYPDLDIVRWSPNGELLIATHNIINATNGKIIKSFDMDWRNPLTTVDWNSTNRYLAMRFVNNILIYDLQADIITQTIESTVPNVSQRSDQTLDWHPDGNRLAVISADGYLRIWQVFEN